MYIFIQVYTILQKYANHFGLRVRERAQWRKEREWYKNVLFQFDAIEYFNAKYTSSKYKAIQVSIKMCFEAWI